MSRRDPYFFDDPYFFESGRAVLKVGSGDYRFVSELPAR